jgi:hypothetical protein
MKRKVLMMALASVVLLAFFIPGCPPKVDEQIRESSHIGALDEATHSRDLAIKAAIEGSVLGDPALKWYADTYGGLTVDVSHAVATITMKVKTQEQHDQVVSLARGVKDVRDIVDNVVIDPAIDDPPFEW